jgi:hypothetical protein
MGLSRDVIVCSSLPLTQRRLKKLLIYPAKIIDLPIQLLDAQIRCPIISFFCKSRSRLLCLGLGVPSSCLLLHHCRQAMVLKHIVLPNIPHYGPKQ